MYFLNSQDKIEGYLFPGTLDAALEYARAHFGVRPEEWSEDSSN